MRYKEELSKKYFDYRHCQKDSAEVKEGIKIIDDVWAKYVAHINDLITSGKIKKQDASSIEKRIEVLNQHWKEFKEAWKVELLKSTQKQKFDCFVEKITELHRTVQKFAYPCWLDRLYQFIKTVLIKLYNNLYAGPRNLSGDHYYIDVSQYEPEASHCVPRKHNYFICQEKLNYNALCFKEALEHWQNPQRHITTSPKR